jgi:hypothetical protein
VRGLRVRGIGYVTVGHGEEVRETRGGGRKHGSCHNQSQDGVGGYQMIPSFGRSCKKKNCYKK